MSASLQSQAESDTIIAFCLCVARASVSLKRLCWNKNLNCISNKSHLWLAIILTYTIRLQKFLAEVLQRKQEIRRCFVFPPHVSSASALPCEIENREDGALVHCACNTLSNFWLRLSRTMLPTASSRTHWLQDLWSNTAAWVWVVSQKDWRNQAAGWIQ